MQSNNNKVLTLVYGSLRKDQYNFRRMGSPECIASEIVIPGWKLYDLGAYPGAVFTGNADDTMVVDLLELDLDTSRRIDAMEIGAGYSIKGLDDVDLGGGVEIFAKIYEYDGKVIEDRLVESGDWIKYLESNA